MNKSVLNVNGEQLTLGYSKQESDNAISALLQRAVSQFDNVGIHIYDLYMPRNTKKKDPQACINELIKELRANFSSHPFRFVWKQDTIKYSRYAGKHVFNEAKVRLRFMLILNADIYKERDDTYRYVVKTWCVIHGALIKDSYRLKNNYANSNDFVYLIGKDRDELDTVMTYTLGYFNPNIKPTLAP